MKKKHKNALAVSLLGIDERSTKLLALFFEKACEGFAEIVEDTVAKVDLIDLHFADSEKLLDFSLSRQPNRPVIVLYSRQTALLEHNYLLYLEKPIRAEQMMEAIDWAKDVSEGKTRGKPIFPERFVPETKRPEPIAQPEPKSTPVETAIPVSTTVEQKAPSPIKPEKIICPEEQQKTKKFVSALIIEEDQFDEFVGMPKVNVIDINSKNDRGLAGYDVKNYYQGFFQIAFKLALANKQMMQLNCNIWKPLVILPHSNEIWVDTTDKLLKEVSGIWMESNNVTITAVDKVQIPKIVDLNKIQDVNAFLWKLALWTSKGRYPKTIDVDKPIYLKRWPDFARYVITPHAMRITALLITRGSDTMLDIAHLLNIELRYVYIFVSATHALGLSAQANRQADSLVATTLPDTKTAKKSIFRKIIDKLRGH